MNMAAKFIICLALLTAVLADSNSECDLCNEELFNEFYEENADIDDFLREGYDELDDINCQLCDDENKEVSSENYCKLCNEDNTEEKDKKDKSENTETTSTTRRTPTYEVHENIKDIPDNNRTPAGPIVPNYTRPSQHNTVRPNSTTPTVKPDETTSRVTVPDTRSTISILVIKGEKEDNKKPDKNILQGIIDAFSGIRNKFVTGINGLFNKNRRR